MLNFFNKFKKEGNKEEEVEQDVVHEVEKEYPTTNLVIAFCRDYREKVHSEYDDNLYAEYLRWDCFLVKKPPCCGGELGKVKKLTGENAGKIMEYIFDRNAESEGYIYVEIDEGGRKYYIGQAELYGQSHFTTKWGKNGFAPLSLIKDEIEDLNEPSRTEAIKKAKYLAKKKSILESEFEA